MKKKWKDSLLEKDTEYTRIDTVYTKGDILGNSYLETSKKEGGTDFFTRSQIPGTHSYFDTKIIYRHLEQFVQEMSPSTVLDLGCGDGRATIWFLKNTSVNIIAVDGSLDSLMRLKRNYLDVNHEYIDRVLLIHASILDIPVVDSCCDFVWAFEVLYYLGERFEEGIQESRRILDKGGAFINGERDKEVGLIYELLERGPHGMITAYNESHIIDRWNAASIRTPLFNTEEVCALLRKNKFTVKKTTGVSIFPLIISYLKNNDLFCDDIKTYAQELTDICIHYSKDGSSNRVTLFVSRKDE